MEDSIKKIKAFQLKKILVCTFCCHLLNVAGCLNKTSKTFETTNFWVYSFVTMTYFLDVLVVPKQTRKLEFYVNKNNT